MSSSGLNETLSEYIRIHKELSDLRKNQTKLKHKIQKASLDGKQYGIVTVFTSSALDK
jgi:predicted HTH transcriptional regulator